MTGKVPSDDDLRDIQGNILGGFKQRAQTFLFFTFPDDKKAARRWLSLITSDVASARDVLNNNASFKARRGSSLFTPAAAFVNIAFTFKGLAALGLASAELQKLPGDFRDGMRARAARLGDVDDSAPDKWIGRFASEEPHVMLLLAADDEHQLRVLSLHHIQLALVHGLHLMHLQPGHLRRGDQEGHEHFGFKDGISQPGVRGVDQPDDPVNNPDQGQPGQDLLWPGEFVIGYTAQNAVDADEPGDVKQANPAFTLNGSYLVYRRLRQDVAGFRAFIAQASAQTGESVALTGARLVGRYESGAPLEQLQTPGFPDPLAGDPSHANAAVLDRAHINNFEYGHDAEGKFVPRAAHIRKVYPRDQVPPGEAQTQTHRMLRRGIPFGESFVPGEHGQPHFPFDRGLNFLAYQSSIENQFEFVQQAWVNDVNFPQGGDGQDPVIAQKDGQRTFSFTARDGRAAHLQLMKRWVTTTAGAYLFAPAISVLRSWK